MEKNEFSKIKVGNSVDYDFVFIGTGIISILEAIYQNLCGKKVLMIDQQNGLGGAWMTLNIFGFEDVENAIHYFLPDPKGIQFMRDVLQWRVARSESKYRIFEKPILGIKKIAYDHPFEPCLEAYSRGEGIRKSLKQLFIAIQSILKGKRKVSRYVEGGAAEMLSKVKAMLTKTSVEVKTSTSIEDILIDPDNEKVEFVLNRNGVQETVVSRSVYLTHGTKIKNLRDNSKTIEISEQIHSRPAAHILVNDETPTKVLEAIFTNNKYLKYAHDITRFARPQGNGKANLKIFVFGLHPHVTPSQEFYPEILDMLKKTEIVGKNATLEGQYWWDVYLPALDDGTLEHLQQNYGKQISILKTENFTRGIGYHADRWSTKIKEII